MTTEPRFPRLTPFRVVVLAACVAISLLINFGFDDVVIRGIGAAFPVFAGMELARRWRRQDETNRSATSGSDSEQ